MAAPLEPETTPEEYRQRALLLADLGRYDEAAQEVASGLAAAPDEASLLATLARIHLAADQPGEALRAAERAVAASPSTLTNLVVRAMALSDSQKYGEAAQVASEIIRQWPADAYAQRTGAALLSESRNGQEALNAAWNAVRVAPAEAEAHLVLAVVAARLRLFDLAQRAYAQALDLDPAIGDAQRDVGIVRFERRRWAKALESLADDATLPVAPDAEGEYPQPFPRAYPAPDRPDTEEQQATSADWTGEGVVSRPSKPVLDPSADSAEAIRRHVLFGTNATLVAGLFAGLMTLTSAGISRTWGGLIGVLLFAGVIFALNRAVPEPLAAALTRLRQHNRPLAAAAYVGFVAPLLLFVYALVGGVVPLVVAMAVAALAEILILTRR
ncbi:tetratricopeptide repeat protein [Paractinoplanes lichenicola]|uniref:Tetratricopeptide repeat protein n=1 Tax=Paractinoplanes lichenicola TaxID=2802976 RepID=A0ABS1VIK6_9ACTN|nr:tetratricopeptide repeat protein [Actinoplanes lichenicola]MBL7254508.1 tetratricopeptide repeat protein [Actinoplanes lichenicola]